MMKMKRYILPLIILIAAFFLLTYRNTKVPPGINGDEVGIAHNAALMSKNLTDENNNFLPLFIFAKSSDWKQPVTVYSTAFVFRVFGISFENLRMTSALFVIVTLVILYFFSKEKYNFKFFVVSSLIFLTVPIILIQSHLGLENIAPLPFILFWLWMLVKYERTKNKVFLILSGGSLGVGLFSYLGMRIISPMLVVISLVYLFKFRWKVFYFLAGAVPFFILLWISNYFYPGAVTGHFSAPTPTINEFLLRYLSNFDFSFLFLKGDAVSFHSTGQAGMFLVATLPIFLIGIYEILKNRKPFEILILVSFFISPVLFGFVPDIYRASRIVALVPLFIIISTIGFQAIGKRTQILIAVLILINFIFFAKDYWFDYATRVGKYFPMVIDKYTSDFVFKGS